MPQCGTVEFGKKLLLGCCIRGLRSVAYLNKYAANDRSTSLVLRNGSWLAMGRSAVDVELVNDGVAREGRKSHSDIETHILSRMA